MEIKINTHENGPKRIMTKNYEVEKKEIESIISELNTNCFDTDMLVTRVAEIWFKKHEDAYNLSIREDVPSWKISTYTTEVYNMFFNRIHKYIKQLRYDNSGDLSYIKGFC